MPDYHRGSRQTLRRTAKANATPEGYGAVRAWKEAAAISGLRERKREQNRVTAAETAWRLFIERGYDNVTVSDICAAADIAPRSFHRYFANKEDVVAEPVNRMSQVVVDYLAAAPASAGDAEVVTGAMRRLGQFAVDNRELLTALRVVVRQSQHLRASNIALKPEQEREIAALVAARHAAPAEPDWRLRLLVTCAVSGFRVWLDDYFADPGSDLAHLDEVLGAIALAV